MQKKKPPFQVIPNYGVSALKRGMNLKKCLGQQGPNDTGLRNLADRGRPIRYRTAIADDGVDIAASVEFRHPRTGLVRRNSMVLASSRRDTAALFIELSGEI